MTRALPLLATAALLALAACTKPAEQAAQNTAAPAAPPASAAAPVAIDIPAGAYKLDPAHASLIFSVDHLGFSHYTAKFAKFDAKMELDPKNPGATKLEATVDPKSLTLNDPPAGFLADLTGKAWLDADQFPQMTYRSTSVEPTGPNTAKIIGDFTLHGVTRPVVLEATFNGGWGGMAMDPHARAGFSAHGVLKRGDFGVSSGIPAAGSKMGVSDEVQIQIEAEFTGPAWVAPKT